MADERGLMDAAYFKKCPVCGKKGWVSVFRIEQSGTPDGFNWRYDTLHDDKPNCTGPWRWDRGQAGE